MISSKISELNKKPAGSMIPVRCNKIIQVKRNQSQSKSSSQVTIPSEVKGSQRDATSLKSSEVFKKTVNKSNSSNLQIVEKLKLAESWKTEGTQAKRNPLKLNNKSEKPVPVLQRNLSSLNACVKESKSLDVKKSQIQQNPLKSSNRPAKPVPQRNISSVNAGSTKSESYKANRTKLEVQPVSQKWSKNQDFKSQNKSNPLKKTQIVGKGKPFKISDEPKQSNKDEKGFGNPTKHFSRAVDRKPSKAHNLPSSLISNKENLDTIIVEEVKQITEKRKNKVKKEDSPKIQPIVQKSETNKENLKDTEQVSTQCTANEKENKATKIAIVVSDSEFQNSNFFKSLILSEKDRSPVMMKLCSESNVSSLDIAPKSSMKKFHANYLTEEDFLEDLRRNSANFQKRKGFSPAVPGMKSPAKRYLESFPSVDDFVENLRRNSVNLIRRRATLQSSPHLIGNQSSVKPFLNRYSSAKDIVEDLRRNSASFFKRRAKLQMSPFQNTPYARRWTCNVQSSLVKKFPVVRDETRLQIHNNVKSSVCKNPENVNFQPSALKGSETSKKKDKSKKKVTFYISPPTNSSESTSFTEKMENKNIKTHLLKVPEQSSQNSTPEFEANVYKKKENSVVLEQSIKTRNSSTPEFNFEALKIPIRLSPNEFKSSKKQEIQSTFSNKFDADVKCFEDKRSQDSKCEKPNFSCSQSIASSSSCMHLAKNFETITHPKPNFLHNKIADYKNTVKENIHCTISSHKSFACEGQTAIAKPMKQLSISSDNNNRNETEAFTVKTESVTPHSLSFYSNLINSLSPPIVIDRPSILASYAPISTPLVLESVAQKSNLSPVRQKLDFEEVKLERRESQICLQDVPTLQKMYDYLCDQECCMLSLLSSETLILNRHLSNPIADILSNGDEMHFVPLNSCETPISS